MLPEELWSFKTRRKGSSFVFHKNTHEAKKFLFKGDGERKKVESEGFLGYIGIAIVHLLLLFFFFFSFLFFF